MTTTRYLTLGVIAGGLVMSAAMGVRQTFGLFVEPFAFDHGLPISFIAFAIALHNLVWGFAQPFAGAAADRFGAAPVIAVGATIYAAGLVITALAPGDLMMLLGMGILVGIGISCAGFGVVLTAVGRACPPETRSQALGLASAGGSMGQVLLVPLAQGVTAGFGMTMALIALAGCLLAVAPLGWALERGPAPRIDDEAAQSLPLGAALRSAIEHRGYCLLTLGFFTCGFQLAFVATHLPAYLTLCQMPAAMGATALALIGLFNMMGSWACGWLGGRFRQQNVLGWLYLIRGVAIAAFFLLPKTGASVMIFATVMGLVWLGSVPLTSGLVAKVFGTRHLGTLFGICFLSHQIGGFLGGWLGGYLFDLTGSYSVIWTATALSGLVAAALHFAIDDRPARVPLAPTA